MFTLLDSIVIGGGQAGLASAYYLQKSGLTFKVLESGMHPTGSWPYYYDSLTLFSPARYSSLPGLKFPGKAGQYPERDEVITYLRKYADTFKFPIAYNHAVKEVQRIEEGFEVKTVSDQIFFAKTVISATGSFRHPHVPLLPGIEQFNGSTSHSSNYQNPNPFVNKRIVVVGRGNSAVQIAIELAEYAQVTLAVQQPIQFKPQKFLGLDLHFWLKASGIDFFPFHKIGRTPPGAAAVLDSGYYRRKIAAGMPDQKPMFLSFYQEGVVWPNEQKEPIDHVIWATGYRPNMAYLKKLGALDSLGSPIHRTGISSTVKGLYYVGLANQRSFASATIRGAGRDAKYVVQHLQTSRKV